MKKWYLIGAVAALSLSVAAPAAAHVTVQPNESISESFSAFVVRVPNESDNAATTKVQVQFPPLAFVGFQDVPGWTRDVKMQKLDEPLEAFGEELTEAVGTVTWSGGEIGPGEFAEFPFSAAMPAGEEELEFPAIQTYDNGDVVRWTGPEDADEPAALVHTVELGEFAEQGLGELGTLNAIVHEVEELTAQVEELSTQPDSEPAEPTAAEEDEGADDDDSNSGVLLGGIGIGLGALALLVALFRGRKSA